MKNIYPIFHFFGNFDRKIHGKEKNIYEKENKEKEIVEKKEKKRFKINKLFLCTSSNIFYLFIIFSYKY